MCNNTVELMVEHVSKIEKITLKKNEHVNKSQKYEDVSENIRME